MSASNRPRALGISWSGSRSTACRSLVMGALPCVPSPGPTTLDPSAQKSQVQNAEISRGVSPPNATRVSNAQPSAWEQTKRPRNHRYLRSRDRRGAARRGVSRHRRRQTAPRRHRDEGAKGPAGYHQHRHSFARILIEKRMRPPSQISLGYKRGASGRREIRPTASRKGHGLSISGAWSEETRPRARSGPESARNAATELGIRLRALRRLGESRYDNAPTEAGASPLGHARSTTPSSSAVARSRRLRRRAVARS
jgi:hypothetical protein